MNRWENGIISIYKIGDRVQICPRWCKETHHRYHSTIYKYEVETIYRGCISEHVNYTKLPLALY